MKTPEDEAFDDLARRQGMWGGGYRAKRAAAADKLHWSDCAVHNEPAYPAGACDCGVVQKTEREALELALEALGWTDEWRPQGLRDKAITALKAALAQPAQEPVAWWNYTGTYIDLNVSGRGTPLYTQPPQRPWVGLTDDELADIWYKGSLDWMEFARAVIAKLQARNS